MSALDLFGWDRLRHGGLLLDAPRLQTIAAFEPPAPPFWMEPELRRRLAAFEDGTTTGTTGIAEFARFVLERVCGFDAGSGTWRRGSGVEAAWARRAVTGEAVKPHLLWQGPNGALLPVFLDAAPRLGIGHGRRAASRVAGWLRAGPERLALLTNGRGWRLLFVGADVEAWCEWDAEQWLEEGGLSPQVTALRTLIQPVLFTPPSEGEEAPLAAAVLASRKGQAELSAVLGGRVREAVEILVQGHGDVLRERLPEGEPR